MSHITFVERLNNKYIEHNDKKIKLKKKYNPSYDGLYKSIVCLFGFVFGMIFGLNNAPGLSVLCFFLFGFSLFVINDPFHIFDCFNFFENRYKKYCDQERSRYNKDVQSIFSEYNKYINNLSMKNKLDIFRQYNEVIDNNLPLFTRKYLQENIDKKRVSSYIKAAFRLLCINNSELPASEFNLDSLITTYKSFGMLETFISQIDLGDQYVTSTRVNQSSYQKLLEEETFNYLKVIAKSKKALLNLDSYYDGYVIKILNFNSGKYKFIENDQSLLTNYLFIKYLLSINKDTYKDYVSEFNKREEKYKTLEKKHWKSVEEKRVFEEKRKKDEISRQIDELKKTTRKNELYYRNHCFSCKEPINSSKNVRCSKCGWYTCSCGACGCTYVGKSRSKLPNVYNKKMSKIIVNHHTYEDERNDYFEDYGNEEVYNSVHKSLGFELDDDGNWIPDDLYEDD